MIRIDGPWFKDEHGRTRHLRGVNLSGSSKVPTQPDGATHRIEGFWDHRNVSFIGRPFPLADADEHFERLRTWGLTFLRFLVSWEAIEHAGPGCYDEAYLDYVAQIIEKAAEYDMLVLIDPHQDVWSRFSGGDGAPGWTLEAVGFDLHHLQVTGAATVHQTYGDPYPRMIWPTNWSKLAAATMFTLFFGSKTFAPKTLIEGEPAQDYLQRHYISAIQQLAGRLAGMQHVLGYDTMNEPIRGFIGWHDLHHLEPIAKLGPAPTPFQSMALGEGLPQTITNWSLKLPGLLRHGEIVMNPHGQRAWRDEQECIWKQHGVWEINRRGKPRLLRPEYFTQIDGRPLSFENDFYRPFAERFADAIWQTDPDAIIFLESQPNTPPPDWRSGDEGRIAYIPHWYDDMTLFSKRYLPDVAVDIPENRFIYGRSRVYQSFVKQLGLRKIWSAGHLHNAPVIIGETGIPMDLHRGRAFRTGNFSRQIAAYDRLISALEANLLNFTLWNYSADNTNARGDLWNGEDLSLFSRDQQTNPSDINSGGRALEAVVRPYARATAGEPLMMRYDRISGRFDFRFRDDPAINAPTELFVPNSAYPDGYRVELSDGECHMEHEEQRLLYQPSKRGTTHHLVIHSLSPPQAAPTTRWRWLVIVVLFTVALRRIFSSYNGKREVNHE